MLYLRNHARKGPRIPLLRPITIAFLCLTACFLEPTFGFRTNAVAGPFRGQSKAVLRTGGQLIGATRAGSVVRGKAAALPVTADLRGGAARRQGRAVRLAGRVTARRSRATLWPRQWPAERVISARWMFRGPARRRSRVLLRAHPVLYRPRWSEAAGAPVLVLGLPGHGSRSENFLRNIESGFREAGATFPWAAVVVQDPETGGPRHEGDVDDGHANDFHRPRHIARLTRPLVRRVARLLRERAGGRQVRVFVLGYSNGGLAATQVAAHLMPRRPRNRAKAAYRVEGAICVASGSRASVRDLGDRLRRMRLLFLVAPPPTGRERSAEPDAFNTRYAGESAARLKKEGVAASIRFIQEARRLGSWHRGMISGRNRHFHLVAPGVCSDGPDYRVPNLETYRALVRFLSPP